ncbi:MAG: DUF1778 domain-containing protein [Burkholderiales bacterium]
MNIATAKRQRISPRFPDLAHELLERAAEIYGVTVSQFIVQAAVKEAQAVLARERLIRLSIEDARVLAKAMVRPPAPNAKRKKA